MKLYEFEGKQIFNKYGINLPQGLTVNKSQKTEHNFDQLRFPVVAKAQLLRGGRKKIGGVQFANDEQQLNNIINTLLETAPEGELIEELLIEETLNITKELYVGITIDTKKSLPVLIFSMYGGIDIEELAEEYPDELMYLYLNPLSSCHLYQVLEFLRHTKLTSVQKKSVSEIILKLRNAYFDYNCITAEINPLCLTEDDKVIAADSKIEIDDSALFKIKEAKNFKSQLNNISRLEAEAKKNNISYVELGQGDIGLIAGGAGLGMATMDMISYYGGKPANFLDLGGNATKEVTANALDIILQSQEINKILINVFGGINNCEEMAKGIADIYDKKITSEEIVVKMRGHSQEEGWAILEQRNIPLVKYGTTSDAVKKLLKNY